MDPLIRFAGPLLRVLRPARLSGLRPKRPASDVWGYDRGDPIDRLYIDRFLRENRADIRGRVLEIKDNSYSRQHGTSVRQTDVLDIDAANPRATIIADLQKADPVSGDTYDCFILTQTLQFCYDPSAALRHAHRVLKPGGVLLATVPTVTRSDPNGYASDYWRFTAPLCERLFAEIFGEGNATVTPHGNVVACMGFLNGMAQQEFSPHELEPVDSLYTLLVTIRARKAPA